uniref:Peptidoglycan-recognition protein LA n=1 Tax=Bactrocera latifrons TaxID=174628 RepID=A0A0K8VH19_BACLA
MKLLLKVNSERARKRYAPSAPAATATTRRINQNTSNVNTSVFQKLSTSSKLLLLLIVVVIIVAVVIIYIQIQQNNKQQPGPIVFGNTYEHGTFPNLGNGHLVIDREQWGASELSKTLTVPLKHPIPYVIITHIGVQSKPCETVYKCSIKMRTIQDSAIAEKKLTRHSGEFLCEWHKIIERNLQGFQYSVIERFCCFLFVASLITNYMLSQLFR